jgi:hypothetical protein
MPLTDAWLAAALSITGDFETSGDPWTAVSGDFDRMGISCGPLQWNIGQGSLQPIVLAAGRTTVSSSMPNFGSAMWSACQGTIAAGLQIVRSWQDGANLRPGPLRELKALLAMPAMRAEMVAAVAEDGQTAYDLAAWWERTASPSGRGFAFFFDTVVQQGSLKGLKHADVAAYLAKHGAGKADDTICDWLEGQGGASGHARDARRNAAMWRDTTSATTLELLVLAFLRSGLGNPVWRTVVMNRKGTLAMGSGWVNGSQVNLAALYPT